MRSHSFIESNLQLCSFRSTKMSLPCKRNLWLSTSIYMLSLISSLALFVPRNFTEAPHLRLHGLLPLKIGILEQDLEMRDALVKTFSDVDFCLY